MHSLACCYCIKHPRQQTLEQQKAHFNSIWEASVLVAQADSCKPLVRGKHITEHTEEQNRSPRGGNGREEDGMRALWFPLEDAPQTHKTVFHEASPPKGFPALYSAKKGTTPFIYRLCRDTPDSRLLIACLPLLYACSCFVLTSING